MKKSIYIYIYHWHPLPIGCESAVEASRVDMDMLGDSLLLWCEITCWNTKFGFIAWRGIQNMTSAIFYRKATWIYILRKAITKRFLQREKNRLYSQPQKTFTTIIKHWLSIDCFSTCGPVAPPTFLLLTLHRLQIKSFAIQEENEPTEDGKPKEPENPQTPQTEEVGRVGTVEGSCTGSWVGSSSSPLVLLLQGCKLSEYDIGCTDPFQCMKKSIYHWPLIANQPWNHGGFKSGYGHAWW